MLLVYCSNSFGQTVVKELDLWKFYKGANATASQIDFDDADWESVKIPHDWAIFGPFDEEIDKQVVQIEQNNEEKALKKQVGQVLCLSLVWVGIALSSP